MRTHVAFLTLSLAACAPEPGDEPVASRSSGLIANVPPVVDTWANNAGGWQDFGTSCELRVNNNPQNRAVSLLRFNIPGAVCATLANATLTLQNAQLTGPLNVRAHQVLAAWAPGPTGAAGCVACNVTSVNPNPFVLPPVAPPVAAAAVAPPACGGYNWNITAMVAAWCANPAINFGVLLDAPLGDGGGLATVNFHSMDAPAGTRPVLTITY